MIDQFTSSSFVDDESTLRVYETIFPYLKNERVRSTAEAEAVLDKCFGQVTAARFERSFAYLLRAITKEDVDKYIERNIAFAGKCQSDRAQFYIKNVLSVDSGNSEAIKMLFDAEVSSRDMNRGYLEVRAGNEPAKRLYLRHGFVVTGRRERYYADSGEDALVMAEQILSTSSDGGKREDNSVTFQILVNRIESLRRFIANTANSVGFVADGLEAESSCIEGASAILHENHRRSPRPLRRAYPRGRSGRYRRRQSPRLDRPTRRLRRLPGWATTYPRRRAGQRIGHHPLSRG